MQFTFIRLPKYWWASGASTEGESTEQKTPNYTPHNKRFRYKSPPPKMNSVHAYKMPYINKLNDSKANEHIPTKWNSWMHLAQASSCRYQHRYRRTHAASLPSSRGRISACLPLIPKIGSDAFAAFTQTPHNKRKITKPIRSSWNELNGIKHTRMAAKHIMRWHAE